MASISRRFTTCSPEQIRHELSGLPGWDGDEGGLLRRLRFRDFREALRFMGACVEPIERLDHHPAWANVYDRVEIRLVTHDAGDRVTSLDFELARALESIAAGFELR